MRGKEEHIKGKDVYWLTLGFQDVKSTSPLIREAGALRVAGDTVVERPAECWPRTGAQPGPKDEEAPGAQASAA